MKFLQAIRIREIRKYAKSRIVELDEQIIKKIIDGEWILVDYLRCQREYWRELLKKTEEKKNG